MAIEKRDKNSLRLYFPFKCSVEECSVEECNISYKKFRDKLCAISRSLTGLRYAICMYPECEAKEHLLDVHHIQFQKYGGQNEIDNLILFCPNHHREAHLYVFPPEFCFYFKKEGSIPASVLELRELQLTQLWERLVNLSEFSESYREMNVYDKLKKLSEIVLAVYAHPSCKDDHELWSHILGWSHTEQAWLLVALIPGISNMKKTHRMRDVISTLVSVSYKYCNKHRVDHFDLMLEAKNEHILAVNHNAKLQIESACKRIKKSYNTIKMVRGSLMPVRIEKYQALLLRQMAAILAKAADRKAIDYAEQGIKLARDSSQFEKIEAVARLLDASMLLRDYSLSEKTQKFLLNMDEPQEAFGKILHLRKLANWHLSQESYREARNLAEKALNIAESNNLLHQHDKIQSFLRAWDQRKTLCHHWVFKKSDCQTQKPSKLLLSII